MSLALILLVLGLVAGLARGGKLENVTRVHFRRPWLVFVGLAFQVGAEVAALFLPGFREGGRGLAVLALSYGLLIAFVVMNRALPGALLIAAGLSLNLLVIVLNGGMPVSLRAARAAGFDASGYLASAVKHRVQGPGTLLPFLGDVIPLPLIQKVVSVGDIVLGAGIFVLVKRLVEYRPRRAAAPRTSDVRSSPDA